jgi:hypothetical protein
MKALPAWIAAACILALGAGPANAITITETINFTAHGLRALRAGRTAHKKSIHCNTPVSQHV